MSTDTRNMDTIGNISAIEPVAEAADKHTEIDRLQLIESGQIVSAVIHEDIKQEDIILDIEKLNLLICFVIFYFV